MTDKDWILIAYAVIAFLVVQATIYFGFYRPKIRRLKEEMVKSDEAWKGAIDVIQKQVYRQD